MTIRQPWPTFLSLTGAGGRYRMAGQWWKAATSRADAAVITIGPGAARAGIDAALPARP